MSIVVKTDNAARANVAVVLPFVGLKTPNDAGEFEHEDVEEVNELSAAIPEFYVKQSDVDSNVGSADEESDDLGSKSEEDELNDKANEDNLGGSAENELIANSTSPDAEDSKPSAEEIEAYIAELGEKKHKELVELCGSFPGGEWRGKNKEQLVEYLTGKLS